MCEPTIRASLPALSIIEKHIAIECADCGDIKLLCCHRPTCWGARMPRCHLAPCQRWCKPFTIKIQARAWHLAIPRGHTPKPPIGEDSVEFCNVPVQFAKFPPAIQWGSDTMMRTRCATPSSMMLIPPLKGWYPLWFHGDPAQLPSSEHGLGSTTERLSLAICRPLLSSPLGTLLPAWHWMNIATCQGVCLQ